MTTNVLVMEGRERTRGSRAGGRTSAFTRNLVPGNRVYDEDLLKIRGAEYRTWDPFRSKLAGAILKGELPPDVIKEGDKVLYLGASTGTTVSHVSDIVGAGGLVVGVELSARVGREFLEKVAKARPNVIPYISDARDVERFGEFGKMDVVYCDIARVPSTKITYQSGPLEGLQTRRWVIDVLEGTGRAFGKRHDKYGIGPHGELVLRGE